MKKFKIFILLFVLLLCFTMPIASVSADTGPKPSVRVNFENTNGNTFYVTLLSKTEYSGPASVWDGNEDNIYYHNDNLQVFYKFVNYKDSDGFYFLQTFESCTNYYSWNYYPPKTFKILIYFPNTDSFAVSQICDRYAFHSYYKVDLTNLVGEKITAEQNATIIANESYDYKNEIITFFARLIITLVIELGIALLFKFREKKQLLFFLVVNLITQIALNVALAITNYQSGFLKTAIVYFNYEFFVLLFESLAYALLIDKFSSEKQKTVKIVLYTLTANFCSFLLGIIISLYFPFMF